MSTHNELRSPLLGCFIVVAAASSSCGGSNDAADPFVGAWSCSGMETITYTLPPGAQPVMTTSNGTVMITDDGNGALTIVRTPGDGAPVCTVHAHLGADRASFTWDSGQSCINKLNNTMTYKSAMATLTAAGYSAMSTWDVTGANQAGAPLMGMGMGSSTCVRMP